MENYFANIPWHVTAGTSDGNGIYGGSGSLSGNTVVTAGGNDFSIAGAGAISLTGTSATVTGSGGVTLSAGNNQYTFNPPPTLDSDNGNNLVSIHPTTGVLSRANVSSVQALGGTAAPANGTTTAWYVGQPYIDRTNNKFYVATAASTNPDSAATGSVWQEIHVANTTVFAPSDQVTVATAGHPTEAEIKTWATANSHIDKVIRYTGTTTSTDALTYAFYVDRSGEVTVIHSTPQVSRLQAIQNAIQTGVTSNTAIAFQTTLFTSGSSITKTSNTQITLAAGKTYRLTASLTWSGVGSGAAFTRGQWYNVTGSAYAGSIHHIENVTNAGNGGGGGLSVLLFTATAATTFEYRVVNTDQATQIGDATNSTAYSWYLVEEI